MWENQNKDSCLEILLTSVNKIIYYQVSFEEAWKGQKTDPGQGILVRWLGAELEYYNQRIIWHKGYYSLSEGRNLYN